MSFNEIIQKRLKTQINAKLAADIDVQRVAQSLSGEFLIKLTLEIYTFWRNFIDKNGGTIPGVHDIKPEEIREMAMMSIRAFLKDLTAQIGVDFDIDSETAKQLENGQPTYVSMLVGLMIFSSSLQAADTEGIVETAIIDTDNNSLKEKITPKSQRRKILGLFKSSTS